MISPLLPLLSALLMSTSCITTINYIIVLHYKFTDCTSYRFDTGQH